MIPVQYFSVYSKTDAGQGEGAGSTVPDTDQSQLIRGSRWAGRPYREQEPRQGAQTDTDCSEPDTEPRPLRFRTHPRTDNWAAAG
jgi:hypothetical protein